MLINLPANALLKLERKPSSALLPWLTYQNSLTERLQAKAGNTYLDVLGQDWHAPTIWEKEVLSISDKSVFCREIVMQAFTTPCWYARTIIPQSSYEAGIDIFVRLKNESLGLLIFSEVRIKRVSLMHYPIDTQCMEYYWLDETMHAGSKLLWARLSVFLIDETFPFCLIEIMLPGIMRYSN